MTPKTPNFTAYDFLGYTVPGLAAIALLDASIFYHSKGTHFTFDLAVSRYLHLNLASLVPVLLISYLIGHILGFVSSVLIEKHATWMHGVPTNYLLGHGKHSGYFDTAGEVPIASKFLRILSAAMIAPVSVIDGFLTKVIPLSKNYIRPLDPILVEASASAHSAILKKLDVNLEKYSEEQLDSFDVHKLTIHCSLEAAPAHVSSLRNYVVLYGFLRSVTLLMIISFWVIMIHLHGHFHWWQITMSLGLMAIICFVCYAAYLKFRVRYHTEGIMALIASHAKNRDAEQVGA